MGRRKKHTYHTAERQEWVRAYVEQLHVTGTSGMLFSLNDPGKEPTPVDRQTTHLHACFLSRLLGHGYRTGLLSCNPRYDQNGQLWEPVGREYHALCRNYGIVWGTKSGLEEGDDELGQYRTTPDMYHWDPIGTIRKITPKGMQTFRKKNLRRRRMGDQGWVPNLGMPRSPA